jgi:SET domain-containing protein
VVKLQYINILIPTSKIYVTKSTIPNAGRGVFAKQTIGKDELIEKCPVIVLVKEEVFTAGPTLISDYYFNWDEHKFSAAIVFGYGSMFNHSKTPAAYFVPDFLTKTMLFIALRNIKKGEEIFIDYGEKLINEKKNTLKSSLS